MTRSGPPWWVWLPAAAGFALIAVPVAGLVVRNDWSSFGSLITTARISPSRITTAARRRQQ